MTAEPYRTDPKDQAPRNWWLGGAVLAAVLYAAREILVPLALAILMSFVLAPLVRRLQQWRVSKGLSVAIVVVFAFGLVFGIAAFMAQQLTQLAANLPQYQTTIISKMDDLRNLASAPGVFSRAADVIKRLNRELDGAEKTEAKPNGGQAASPAPARPGAEPSPSILQPGVTAPPPSILPSESRPIPVEVHQPEPGGVQLLLAVMGPLLPPIATTGLVVIFVIFILFQRQDLRNRLIRLAGADDLHRTTAALDDAARRLSRLYLVQLGLNAAFGIGIGIGLTIIGVPSPFLWGALAAIFRFVPYVGAFLSAAFPIMLAIAVDPGWSMAIWTVILFLVTEPIMGHLVEPMIQGQTTGLSPVAIVLSAAFWTWLWGPVGLVLSTPLTVCLVVLGRHIDALQSLDVMFGDRPALSAGEAFYQRMLARDPLEAADQAESYLAEKPLESYYDEVGLAGLKLAQADFSRSALNAERAGIVKDSVLELIDHLGHDVETPWFDRPKSTEEGQSENSPVAAEDLAPAFRGEAPVLCIAGRSPLDEAAAAMLAHCLTEKGIAARSVGPEMLTSVRLFQLDPSGVAIVCLCYLDRRSPGSMRYAVKRLRRKLPEATMIVGLWGDVDVTDIDRLRRNVENGIVTVSLSDTVHFARDIATGQYSPGQEPDSAPQDKGLRVVQGSPETLAAGSRIPG